MKAKRSTTRTGEPLVVGLDVTMLTHDDIPWQITKIVKQDADGAWTTESERENGRTTWEAAGAADDACGWRIEPTTPAHRRDIWECEMLLKLSTPRVWESATYEQFEAVARIVGIPMWDAQKEGK